MKKMIIIIIVVFLISFTLWFLYARYVGTKGLIVREYKLEYTIDDNFNGLKIIHFSDLNFKTTVSKKDIENLVTKINFIKPDLVIFSGNLIYNKNINESDKSMLIEYLSKLNPSLGKYAVKGNTDTDLSNEILLKSGFNILNNSYELIYKNSPTPILISGINSSDQNINDKLKETLDYLKENQITFKILVSHEPDAAATFTNFNLILSGNSLNGQIILPFLGGIIKYKGSLIYDSKFYQLDNSSLFISGGIGTTKLKLRFNNKPSINFYRIIKKAS